MRAKSLPIMKIAWFARLGNRSMRCPTSCTHAVVIPYDAYNQTRIGTQSIAAHDDVGNFPFFWNG
jgi:hypothetical protein